MSSAAYDKRLSRAKHSRRETNSKSLSNFNGGRTFNRSPSNSPRGKAFGSYVSNLNGGSSTGGVNKKRSHGPDLVAWDLEDMIHAYEESKALPPILSPSLPTINTEKSVVAGSKPSITEKNQEDVPLFLLSPTLPAIFDETDSERRMRDVKSITSSGAERERKESPRPDNRNSIKPRVKWINLPRPNGPKFLLKIYFGNTSRYKSAFGEQETNPYRELGLGINLNPKQQKSQSPVGYNSDFKNSHHRSRSTPNPAVPSFDGPTPQKDETQIPNISRIAKPSDTLVSSNKKKDLKSVDCKNSKVSLMMNKKIALAKEAREARLASEKLSDSQVKVVAKVDSLLLYLASYDYDEKLKYLTNIDPSERCWNLLYEDCSSVIAYTHKLSLGDEDSFVSNEQKNAVVLSLQYMTSILYSLKALILVRINEIILKTIAQEKENKSSDKSEKDQEKEKVVVTAQKTVIANMHSISTDFTKAQCLIPSSFDVSKYFPITWNKRTSSLEAIKENNKCISPKDESFYLPIGIHSNLHQVSGLLYSFTNEFNENLRKVLYKNGKESSTYTLKSGSKC
ncbi:Piso0_003209 [Millerozyma farinosa CBS 7064]|uniref:Piso0_003209 protein n=1 Tax=Pichia sorbitophila (strain ATCC MYA-4447 / BCRC 22081 / CBS 7064 / NBRC 10061 / NRRL Y-12695) TaxID=559304 RepID=G8YIG6_PICSO|nr:Piso0_003209 [Millerozyma farinosa CBS 7064]CCE80876.1 Piso0_003209 [Millerozyma farinosa CBS 7064]